jgi:hypothetical protein
MAYCEEGKQFSNEAIDGERFELPEESGGPWHVPFEGEYSGVRRWVLLSTLTSNEKS